MTGFGRPLSDAPEAAGEDLVTRLVAALERMSPPPLTTPDFEAADAFVWHASPDRLDPVPVVAMWRALFAHVN